MDKADEIANHNCTIAGLRSEVKSKSQALQDLRHSQSLWSSTYLAQQNVDHSSFQRFMNATNGAATSSTSAEQQVRSVT